MLKNDLYALNLLADVSDHYNTEVKIFTLQFTLWGKKNVALKGIHN